MRLNITKIRAQDYGEYHCVCKNELDITHGVIYIQQPKPYNVHYVPENKEAFFGKMAPAKIDYETVCPDQKCECATIDSKCKDSVYLLYDLTEGRLEVLPLNTTGSGLPLRVTDCILYAVGKPVYHKVVEQLYGSWLKDAATDNDKIWSTEENKTDFLFEYPNKGSFRKDDDKKRTIRLEIPWKVF